MDLATVVWGCEGGEGWSAEGEEVVVVEVCVEGTEKRTVESYLCEKAAEVEDDSGRFSPLLPAKPACECIRGFDRVLPGLYEAPLLESLFGGPVLLT